jgi:hypothetical protein
MREDRLGGLRVYAKRLYHAKYGNPLLWLWLLSIVLKLIWAWWLSRDADERVAELRALQAGLEANS